MEVESRTLVINGKSYYVQAEVDGMLLAQDTTMSHRYRILKLKESDFDNITLRNEFRAVFELQGACRTKPLRSGPQVAPETNTTKQSNPNFNLIQKVVDYSLDPKCYAIVLEGYTQKVKNLFDNRTFLTERQAQDIFQNLFNSLLVLHQNNIAHLDIRLENVVLIDGVYKLANFKHAQLCSRYTTISRYTTTTFQAPELFRGEGNPFRADVWACGVFLYVLLHSRVPFTVEQLQSGNTNLVVKVESHLSPDVKSLLQDLLKIEPEARPALQSLTKRIWLMGGNAKR